MATNDVMKQLAAQVVNSSGWTDPFGPAPFGPASAAYWAGTSMMQQGSQPGRTISDQQYFLAVSKVANGYVLQCGNETWVAKDMDELKDLFVTVIVAQKMGG